MHGKNKQFVAKLLFLYLYRLSNRPSINSSVAFTTNGSGISNGNPVDEGGLAIFIIYTAERWAKDEIECVEKAGVAGVGEDAADGPHEERVGLYGDSSTAIVANLFTRGMTETIGIAGMCLTFEMLPSAS